MSLTVTQIIIVLILHWIADFIMQDPKDAANKAKSFYHLTRHTLMYTTVWASLLFTNMLFRIPKEDVYIYTANIALFILITYVTHTITDFFTSKIVHNKFKRNQYGTWFPNLGAFGMIGFDQILHYVQLFLTAAYCNVII